MVYDSSSWEFHSESAADDLTEAQKKPGRRSTRRTRISAPSGPRAASSCNITAGADAAIPAMPTSILYYEQVATKLGGIDNVTPSSIGCSWRLACSIAA